MIAENALGEASDNKTEENMPTLKFNFMGGLFCFSILRCPLHVFLAISGVFMAVRDKIKIFDKKSLNCEL